MNLCIQLNQEQQVYVANIARDQNAMAHQLAAFSLTTQKSFVHYGLSQ